MSDNTIMNWCESVITGVGGLHDFERYELAVPTVDRDVATAAWVIRCLANPHNEDSQDVLDAILARREEVAANSCPVHEFELPCVMCDFNANAGTYAPEGS